MKGLFKLAILAALVWYGWNHRDILRKRGPGTEVEIVNATDDAALHVRVFLGSTRVAKERIEPRERVTMPFPYSGGTASFHLAWQFENQPVDYTWDGGTFVPGPIPTHHTFQLIGGQSVTWQQVPLGLAQDR